MHFHVHVHVLVYVHVQVHVFDYAAAKITTRTMRQDSQESGPATPKEAKHCKALHCNTTPPHGSRESHGQSRAVTGSHEQSRVWCTPQPLHDTARESQAQNERTTVDGAAAV